MIAVAALGMFVAMFLVVFVLRTFLQKRTTGDTGIRAGVLTASFGSLEWAAGWILVLALLAGVAAPVAEIIGLDPITTNPWIRGTGVVIAALGIALTFMAQMDMGAEWRIGIDTDERTALVTEGAFGIVRNPIFSAMLMAAAGLTLMVPNVISLTGLALLAVAIELQVRYVEEPHLRQWHGTAYATYESLVGRFVPGIGRG